MKSGRAGKKSAGFSVYIVRCKDGTYYCGFSGDVEKRVEAHNNGTGAKYTRARRPVALVYSEKKKTIRSTKTIDAAIGDSLSHPMTQYTLEEFEKAADSYRK